MKTTEAQADIRIPMQKSNVITKERLTEIYQGGRIQIQSSDAPAMAQLRDEAIGTFTALGFPTTEDETWRNTDLAWSLEKPYLVPLFADDRVNFHEVFHCTIPHLETAIIGQLNGWYVSREVPLMILGNGIIMGSLAEAKKKYPDLVERYYGKITPTENDSLTALNTAFAQDGVFIYVPDNVQSPTPVQIINVINSESSLFLQSRNLVILGKGARLSLVHCDDSYNHEASFSNIVTEVHLGDNASMDHYKLQNLNNHSTLISTVGFSLGAAASLESHYISLNGGLLRNNIRLRFDGRGGDARIYGIYLMDRKQQVDNHVVVDHAHPGCTSSETFKGILDEQARAVFNGHVLVREDAHGTDARQNNRNILLTDTARVNSKPFLEIYNDDVKCSHGSTTGQLDADSMYYLRQRGIGEETARMLLMFAFADEIVAKIAIAPLRQRIEDMVKKRLQGELQICEQCVLHCSTPDHPVDFKIDLSRI